MIFDLLHTQTTGQITQEESFFTYSEDLSSTNFSVPDHEPVFLDELGEIPQDVVYACGDNVECRYDATQTGNLDIGLDTLTTNEANIEDQNVASK